MIFAAHALLAAAAILTAVTAAKAAGTIRAARR